MFRRYGMLAIVVPAMTPPPMPFKLFVLVAGIADIRPLTLCLAVFIGRMIRFGAVGWLAYKYGEQATDVDAPEPADDSHLAGDRDRRGGRRHRDRATPARDRLKEEPVAHSVSRTLVIVLASSVGTSSFLSKASAAGQAPAAGSAIKVCGLLTKEEVKKHLPWQPMFDNMPIEERPIPPNGSSCSYPSAEVQVLPSTSRLLEIAKQRGKLEPISGLGDEAYFFLNPSGYVEIYVRAGKYIVTVQADADDKGARNGATNLAKALIGKLK